MFGPSQLIGILTAAAGLVGAVAAVLAALLGSQTIAAQIAGVIVAIAILIFAVAILVLVLKKEAPP